VNRTDTVADSFRADRQRIPDALRVSGLACVAGEPQAAIPSVAVKIGKSIRYVVAAPDYLKGRKLPADPEELKAHNCVLFNARNGQAEWDLMSARKRQRVHVRGSIASRDCQSAAAFVLRGHGVGLLETAYADEALARGDLVRLLPRWTSTEVPVFAVYPTRKFLPPRVSAFLSALTAWKNLLWISG